MSKRKDTIDRVLEKHGQTFAEELGINVARNTPSPLFRLLCFCLLASARISHDIALKAAKALADAGWTTASNMQDSTWKQRTRVLNRSGYARYDESTSRMLADTVDVLLDDYDGDLRKLREAADGDIDALRRRLKKFKGIGDAGADMFLREVQVAWDEVYPFMDKRAEQMADELGLPKDAKKLAKSVDGPQEFARLVDGLIRAGFDR